MSGSITQAMILAAGKGTRMREMTDELPKPMIPVRGKPILQWIVDGLIQNGIERILIVVGYRKDVVMDHFDDGSHLGIEIEYVVQQVQNGTGKVVELGKGFTGNEPFILSYGDILVPAESYAPITQLGADDGIITVKVNQEVSKGGAVFIENGYVTDLIEKPQPGQPTSPYYNAGIYAFTPAIYDFTAQLKLSPRNEYELTDAIRDMAKSGKRIRAEELTGDWADVRDPETLAELNKE